MRRRGRRRRRDGDRNGAQGRGRNVSSRNWFRHSSAVRSRVSRRAASARRLSGNHLGHHEHCTLLTGLDHGHEWPAAKLTFVGKLTSSKSQTTCQVGTSRTRTTFRTRVARNCPPSRNDRSRSPSRDSAGWPGGARPGGVIEAVERRPGCLLALAGVPATGGREESIGRIEADGQYLAERKFSRCRPRRVSNRPTPSSWKPTASTLPSTLKATSFAGAPI